MVELTLPKNSTINKNGKIWKAKEGAEKIRTFRVYRYDPSTPDNPSVDSYEVDVSNVSMVLDARSKMRRTRPLLSGGHAAKAFAGPAP